MNPGIAFKPAAYSTLEANQFTVLENLVAKATSTKVDEYLRGFKMSNIPPKWLDELPKRITPASITWRGVQYFRRPTAYAVVVA